MLTALILVIPLSFLWIILHIVWMHIHHADNRFSAMLNGFLLSLPVLLIALWCPQTRAFHAALSPEPYGLVIFHAALAHVLIFFCFVECFYHIERAVTFRMLIEIAAHEEGIPVAALKQDYHISEMIATRMNTLMERQFVYEKDGRWHLLPKGRWFARLMHFTLWLYNAQSQKDREN